jgi:lipopolysaccharide transport system permease protein
MTPATPEGRAAPLPAAPRRDAVVDRGALDHNVQRVAVRFGDGSQTLPNAIRDIWDSRELLYFLVWRDVKVRYRQTVLGVAWAVLQPVLMMLVFALVLGRVAGAAPRGVPYPLFVLCGLVPWQLFAHALTSSTASVVENERLITRVYFPRLIIPMASVIAGLADFVIAFVLLILVAAFYSVGLSPRVLALPLFILLGVLVAVGVGTWLAALNVRYRDVRYTLGFLTQLWFFATPIAYATTVIPARWQWVYLVNPMAGVVEGFRWALLGTATPPLHAIATWTAVVLCSFIAGVGYFRATEQTFADVI